MSGHLHFRSARSPSPAVPASETHCRDLLGSADIGVENSRTLAGTYYLMFRWKMFFGISQLAVHISGAVSHSPFTYHLVRCTSPAAFGGFPVACKEAEDA